jgi:hypothetical protein
MLWVAWCIGVSAFALHASKAGISGSDLYSIIGMPAAVVQGLLIYLMGRRSDRARVISLLLAIPAFVVAVWFFSDQVSSVRLGVEALLRGPALIILLTPVAAQWFRRAEVAV